MNCDNCGAPLTIVDGREHFACSYCATVTFPSDWSQSVDRIKPLGENGESHCPVCEEALSVGAMEGCRVRYCEKCRGILLCGDDFSWIVRRRRAMWSKPSDEPRTLNRKELERRIECPICRSPMEVHPYYGPGSVVIDSCRPCHAIWLDYAEMAAIERAPGRR